MTKVKKMKRLAVLGAMTLTVLWSPHNAVDAYSYPGMDIPIDDSMEQLKPEFKFADFQIDQYWTDGMRWAIINNLISGYLNEKNPITGKYENLLKPANHLTEAQFLAVMFRYTDPKELKNTPNKDGWWAHSSYVMAHKYNLPTKATATNKTYANLPITRGQVAQILASRHFGGVVDERTAVDFFIQNGISSQKDYDDYMPNDNLSRAHIVTFMMNYDTFVYNEEAVPVWGYDDFNQTAYWADSMIWAINKGIISGYKSVMNTNTGEYENLLKPSDSLTEAQFLSVLFRSAKPEELSTTSEVNGWWASKGYILADKYNIPTTASAYNSKGSDEVMTRGKVAVAIATLHHGKVLSERQAVDFMYEAEISTGYDSSKTTFENFGVQDKLTRAHIVTFMKNYDNYLNQ